MPAVGFKLGFARSPGADSAAQSGQRSADSHKPRQAVFQLCQLDLQLALPGNCTSGEDVENEHCPVDYPDVGFVLDIAYLGRGQFAVEYQKLRAEGAAKLPDLRKLAFADDGGCFVGLALLDNARKLLRSGGLSKLREFVHRAFGVVFSGVRTDEYRPCEMFFFHNYSLLKTLVTAE